MERQSPLRRIGDTLIQADANLTRRVQIGAIETIIFIAKPICKILGKEAQLDEFIKDGYEVVVNDYHNSLEKMGK